MSKDRLEAFSDGLITILITIMVLELRTVTRPGRHGLPPGLYGLGISLPFAGRWAASPSRSATRRQKDQPGKGT
jgi:uncharacterized membrane protein